MNNTFLTGTIQTERGPRTVEITRDEWVHHSKGLKGVNEYNRREGRKIYRGQEAIDLVAGWVADYRYEGYCDGVASRRNEFQY